MSTLFYAVCGEGRGHATRVRSIVEELRGQHRVVIYTYGQAYGLLQGAYANTEVELRHIPGLGFAYNRLRRLDYMRTAVQALPYLAQLPDLVYRLRQEIERDAPDLLISDFEPALPRAAKRAGLPFISLDHQHLLATADTCSMALRLQRYAAWVTPVINTFYSGQRQTIVSSFHHLPLQPGMTDVTQIGVLLRPEIRFAEVEQRGISSPICAAIAARAS
jgi:uncharacterized protein (TIGR00661 family)